MALNATPGDPNANSYTDVAYGDAYFQDRLHSDLWTNAITTTKESALIWATRLLDPEDWRGTIASDTQALSHPRDSLYDSNDRLLANDLVANAIQDATCEYALVLISGDGTLDTGLESYDGLKVDVIDLRINQSFLESNKKKLPANVQRILNGYLENTDFGLKGTGSAVRTYRS